MLDFPSGHKAPGTSRRNYEAKSSVRRGDEFSEAKMLLTVKTIVRQSERRDLLAKHHLE